jgi:hypothetical protein
MGLIFITVGKRSVAYGNEVVHQQLPERQNRTGKVLPLAPPIFNSGRY